MTDIPNTFNLDGERIDFEPGETSLQGTIR